MSSSPNARKTKGKDNLETALKTLEDIRRQKHYTQFKIQPMEFSGLNGLDFLQGNVIKYVCRYKLKNGVEDLKKARHYLDCLIEREEKGTITL